MATFVLVPGAGGNASYWNELVPKLEAHGHEALPVDILEDDPALGLPEYASLVEDVIGERTDTVLVGQSLGGFTVAMVAAHVPVRMIVLLNAMIPLPGETPGEWWDAVGSERARREAAEAHGYNTKFDMETYFLHDVRDEVRDRVMALEPPRQPSDTPFGQPCEFERWPSVPIKVLAGADDRFFPPEFQLRVARDRLGVEAVLVPGGHLAALSRSTELADRLDGYVR